MVGRPGVRRRRGSRWVPRRRAATTGSRRSTAAAARRALSVGGRDGHRARSRPSRSGCRYRSTTGPPLDTRRRRVAPARRRRSCAACVRCGRCPRGFRHPVTGHGRTQPPSAPHPDQRQHAGGQHGGMFEPDRRRRLGRRRVRGGVARWVRGRRDGRGGGRARGRRGSGRREAVDGEAVDGEAVNGEVVDGRVVGASGTVVGVSGSGPSAIVWSSTELGAVSTGATTVVGVAGSVTETSVGVVGTTSTVASAEASTASTSASSSSQPGRIRFGSSKLRPSPMSSPALRSQISGHAVGSPSCSSAMSHNVSPRSTVYVTASVLAARAPATSAGSCSVQPTST